MIHLKTHWHSLENSEQSSVVRSGLTWRAVINTRKCVGMTRWSRNSKVMSNLCQNKGGYGRTLRVGRTRMGSWAIPVLHRRTRREEERGSNLSEEDTAVKRLSLKGDVVTFESALQKPNCTQKNWLKRLINLFLCSLNSVISNSKV